MTATGTKSAVNSFSYWTLIFIFIFLSFERITIKKWHEGCTQLSYDSFGYYLYLPSAFIYHDFSNLNYLENILLKYKPTNLFSQAVEGPRGRYVNKYQIGQSILYSPFFLFAHYIYAPLTDYPRDGFSKPYQKSIAIGCLLYTFIGLYFLRKILLQYYPDFITAFVLVLVALGTNYLHYATNENTMPHNQLFAVFSVIIYCTILYYENSSRKLALLIGFLIGFAGLIRPTEMIIGLIPVFWNVENFDSLKNRIRLHWKNIAMMVLCSIIVFSLQIMYWKIQSGRWLFYAYGIERLTLLSPHFADVLFSFRKGWFVYTPVMFLAIIGFIPLFKNNRGVFIPLFLFTIINIWIVSSWDCWWYGGSFGQRSMIQFYVISSFPLGSILFSAWTSDFPLFRKLVFAAGFFFLVLNIFQEWQYSKNIIRYDGMSMAAYKAVFGKTVEQPGLDSLLEEADYSHYQPEQGVAYKEHLLVDNNFNSGFADGIGFESSGSLHSVDEFYPSYSFAIPELYFLPDLKIRCSMKFLTKFPLQHSYLIMVVDRENQPPFIYKDYDFSQPNFDLNKWHDVEMVMDIPKFLGNNYRAEVYLWNRGDKQLYIDDFKIIVQKKVYL